MNSVWFTGITIFTTPERIGEIWKPYRIVLKMKELRILANNTEIIMPQRNNTDRLDGLNGLETQLARGSILPKTYF